MSKETGGPAFPSRFVKHKPQEVGNHVAIYEDSSGMTLRDYFAAKAMDAMVSGSLANGQFIDSQAALKICKSAFVMADAMIAERAK